MEGRDRSEWGSMRHEARQRNKTEDHISQKGHLCQNLGQAGSKTNGAQDHLVEKEEQGGLFHIRL